MILNNNVEFILPIITDKLPVLPKFISKIDIELFGEMKLVCIHTENFKPKEFVLMQCKNFYNVVYTNSGAIIKYLIPEHLMFICNSIIKCGYSSVSKDILFDCINFWKNFSFQILINENTQAARKSSLGIFYLSICII